MSDVNVKLADEMLSILKFIDSGLRRGKIKDVSVMPPTRPGATDVDLTSLSEMVRSVIAKAEAR